MLSIFSKFFEKSSTGKLLPKQKLEQIERLINHKVNSPEIFVQAFSHRSVVDGKKYKRSNERLEFLGDSVLGLSISISLFNEFTEQDEGFLTRVRSNFVNRNTLYEAATRINLIDFLFIHSELMSSAGVGIRTIVADAFEAFIGAIYIDSGFDVANEFITKYVYSPNVKLGLHLTDDNYKSQLLELTQSLKMDYPKYHVVNEEGPEHERIFTIAVNVGEEMLGVGKGRNKKSAEQEAAQIALKKFKNRLTNN